jgi:hypothetical protein
MKPWKAKPSALLRGARNGPVGAASGMSEAPSAKFGT